MGIERVAQSMSDISRLADDGCDGDRGDEWVFDIVSLQLYAA